MHITIHTPSSAAVHVCVATARHVHMRVIARALTTTEGQVHLPHEIVTSYNNYIFGPSINLALLTSLIAFQGHETNVRLSYYLWNNNLYRINFNLSRSS